MYRRAALIAIVAGTGACDAVFGLEREAVPVDAHRPVDVLDGPVLANHDEDGDGVDDAVDGCPNILDPGQPDRDLDGVGDACDPFPDQKGDRHAYFSSLRDFADWNVVAGEWTQVADGVRVTERSGNLLAALGRPPIANPTVIAVIEQPTSVGNGVYYGVFLVTEAGGALPPGVACYVNPSGELVNYDNRGPQAVAQKSTFSPVTPLVIFLEGTSGRTTPTAAPWCAGRDRNDLLVEALAPWPEVPSAVPAFYVFDGAATFKSVLVLTR